MAGFTGPVWKYTMLFPLGKYSLTIFLSLFLVGLIVCIARNEAIQRGGKSHAESSRMLCFENIFICDLTKKIKNSFPVFDSIYIGSTDRLRGGCRHPKTLLRLNNDNGLFLKQTIVGRKFSVSRNRIELYQRPYFASWGFSRISNDNFEFCRKSIFYVYRLVSWISPCWYYLNGTYPCSLIPTCYFNAGVKDFFILFNATFHRCLDSFCRIYQPVGLFRGGLHFFPLATYSNPLQETCKKNSRCCTSNNPIRERNFFQFDWSFEFILGGTFFFVGWLCILLLGFGFFSEGEGRQAWGQRRNFYLTDLQLKRLNSMSKKIGLSASEILRRAIDEYWERFERKEKQR